MSVLTLFVPLRDLIHEAIRRFWEKKLNAIAELKEAAAATAKKAKGNSKAPKDLLDNAKRVRELAKNPRVVAIGETGLDYHHLPSEEVLKEEQVQVMTALRSETDEEIEAQIRDGAYKSKQASLFQQQLDLAVELGPKSITVNNIAPGAISTPLNANLLNNKAELDALLKNIPLGRMGSVEDVAALAAFLASDEAVYVTGSTYFVDGGLIRNYHEQ